MLNSEKLAIAAHLHVLLRRKTGRVTDTEWMAHNTEYAAEVVRFARDSARKDGHADLEEWAEKLEMAMDLLPAPPPAPPMSSRLLGAVGVRKGPKTEPELPDPDAHRYIRGIR